MDKAREETDKKLQAIEQKIGRVYENSSALKRMAEKYINYMDKVQKKTERSYLAFQKAKDIDDRERLKKLYTDELEALTDGSAEYHKIVNDFIRIMSEVNQQAIDKANDKMAEIYALNYNQLAVDCKRIGITVNDER